MKKIKILSSIVITLAGVAMLISAFTESLQFKIIGYCGFIIFGIMLIIVNSRKN